MFKNIIIMALTIGLALAVFVGIPMSADANGDGCRGHCEETAGGDVDVNVESFNQATALGVGGQAHGTGTGTGSASVNNTYRHNEAAASAANTFATACSQGVSGQGIAGGGSIATGNPVCDWLAVAAASEGRDEVTYNYAIYRAYQAANNRDGTSFLGRLGAKLRTIVTLGIL